MLFLLNKIVSFFTVFLSEYLRINCILLERCLQYNKKQINIHTLGVIIFLYNIYCSNIYRTYQGFGR